jgi:hypothetical protein
MRYEIKSIANYIKDIESIITDVPDVGAWRAMP